MASGNAGKIREIARLLEGLDVEVIPQSALNVSEAEETGATFAENSLIKARHAADATGLAVIADDSGLSVDALGGAPGVYSARYAGVGATADDNIDKLLRALIDTPDESRNAAFHCVATCVVPGDDVALQAEGTWHGRILRERRGAGGFGYDPVFLDVASGLSAAELSPEEKGARSHRGQALRQLVEKLRQRYA